MNSAPTFNVSELVAEPINKTLIGSKIASTIEIIAAEVVSEMVSKDVYNASRADQYYDVALLLKPRVVKKNKKATTETGEAIEASETAETTETPTDDLADDLADTPADDNDGNAEDGEDNADNADNDGNDGDEPEEGNDGNDGNDDPAYQYFGLGRVKDTETNKFVTIEGLFAKKKMFTVNIQAKQMLQGLLAAYIKEVHEYYTNGNNTFPVGDNGRAAVNGLKEFSLTNSTVSFAPFIITASELYDELGLEIPDEDTKGSGALQKALMAECTKLFTAPKGGKSITSKLEEFVSMYIKFLKISTKYFTNHCWETKIPLNAGIVLGILRNLSMILNAKGGGLSESAYEVLTLYIIYITNKNKKAPSKASGGKKASGAKGKGKGRGKASGAKASGAAKGKGKGRGKTPVEPASVDEIGDDLNTAAEEWESEF